MAKNDASSADAWRQKWLDATAADKPDAAVEPLRELERLDGAEPRWPHRLADTLRRLGRLDEAADAYERAVDAYASAGFIARSVAMAKVLATVAPDRAPVIGESEQSTAKALRNRAKFTSIPPKQAPDVMNEAVSRLSLPPPEPAPWPLDDASHFERAHLAPLLEPAVDATDDEVRFDDAAPADGLLIEFCEEDVTAAAILEDAPRLSADAYELVGEEPRAEALAQMSACSLLADCSPLALERLAQRAELVDAEPGDVLVESGTPADALFILAAGTARVEIEGGVQTARLREGEVFGESCLLSAALRSATVRAISKVCLLRFPKAVLDGIVTEYPEVESLLFDLLVRRLISNVLQSSPLFEAFDASTRLEVARLFEARRAGEGVHLFEEGKRADGLYILLTGTLARLKDDGAREPLARGSVLGHASLLSRMPCSGTVEATTESIVLRLPATRFGELVASYPPVLEQLTELAAKAKKDDAFEQAFDKLLASS